MVYKGADKSLARPGRKQANVSVRMAWISFGALLCRKRNLMTARVSILFKPCASLTCFRACFFPGRARDLSAPRYKHQAANNMRSQDSWYLATDSSPTTCEYKQHCWPTGRDVLLFTLPQVVVWNVKCKTYPSEKETRVTSSCDIAWTRHLIGYCNPVGFQNRDSATRHTRGTASPDVYWA